jgi:hypothetical protein
MRIYPIEDSAPGSATPGAVFTASINQKAIPQLGSRLDYIKLGLKGAVSTAAVTLENFALLLQPFTLRKGAENRIVLNGDELAALSAYIFKNRLAIGENTDATGNNFLGNIMIPVFDEFKADEQFLYQLDRVAATNIATETITLTGYADALQEKRRPIHAVRIAHTTSGTAGLETLGFRIPAIGTLKAVMLKVPNGFADGNVDVSVQKLKVLAKGQEVAGFNDLADAVTLADVDYVTPSPLGDLMRQFRIFEFGDLGIDAKTEELTLQLDVQDVSDAVSIVPIIEL